MTGLEAVSAVGANNIAGLAVKEIGAGEKAAASAAPFGSLLTQGLNEVEKKVNAADAMVRAFALDDSIPVHQVTIALEEARLSVEMALQVRTKLVDAYREVMNTQL